MDENFFSIRLKELQEARELNDSQTAKLLGISRQFLSSVKQGDRPMPPMLKFKILDFLGYTWTRNNLLKILPDDVAEALQAKDNARIRPKDDEN